MTAEHSRRNLVLAAIALIGLIALIAAVFIGYWGKRPRLTGSPAGSDDRQQKTQALPKPNTAELRAQAFKAIDAAATAGSLKPHLQSADPAVRSQAIRRLGEIGGEASVPLLAEAFQHEARRKGTDVDAGVHGEAIRAMARIRTAAARTELVRIINEWLQEGSKEQGLYAHILDTQHFAVLKVAIESLESFGDEETHSLLERIRDNASFFYSLREAAGRTLLKREMTGRGLSEPAARATFLVERIDPEGVPVESRWTGRKPGEKTNQGVSQAVIESLVGEIGWPAAAPLESFLTGGRPGDARRILGAARMLCDLVVREIGQPGAPPPEPRHREAVGAATTALAGLSRDALASAAASRVFGELQAAAELIRDEEIWTRLRRLSSAIRIPNVWQGAAPTAADLMIELPAPLTFIPEYSRRVATPFGAFLDVWFFTSTPAPALAARLEKVTGKKVSKREDRLERPGAKAVYEIELQPGPGKVAQLLASVISVFEGATEFEQRVLGRTLRSGRTLIRLRRLVPNASAASRPDPPYAVDEWFWRRTSGPSTRLAGIEPASFVRVALESTGSWGQAPSRPKQGSSGRDPKDRWVKAAFCGTITIDRTVDADLNDGANRVRKMETAHLVARVTGYKKVVSDSTGRAFTIINEGNTKADLTYTEIWSTKGAELKREMQGQGQEQEPSPPSNKGWVELLINEARGRYRLRLPSLSVEGMLNITDTAGGRTLRESRHTSNRIEMDWKKSADRERAYDPESGMISDSYSTTMYDLAHFLPTGSMSDTPWPTPLNHVVTFRANWNLALTESACARSVKLVAPANDEQFVFSEVYGGPVLSIPATAEADPPTYNPTIFPWHIDPIDGSQLQIWEIVGKSGLVEEDRPHGPKVKFVYDGLPPDNNQLGVKMISADIADPVRVKVFFEKDSSGNPEGKAKNWFYYWKQGAVPQLDECKYGGAGDGYTRGEFSFPSTITIYDPASEELSSFTIVLYDRDPACGSLIVFRTIEVPTLEGVDLCHSVVLHELEHKRLFEMFGADMAGGGTLDSDGDGLPDYAEIALWNNYRLDPFEPDTHGLRIQIAMGYWEYGDNELLAREAGLNHAAVHSLDWACPGKQYKK